MKPRLNMDKIANALGGERRGPVIAKGGYFGALTWQQTSPSGSRFPRRADVLRIQPGQSGGSSRCVPER